MHLDTETKRGYASRRNPLNFLAPRPGLEPGTYGLTVVNCLTLRDCLRRVGIVDIPYRSMGYVIFLSRAISIRSTSAIDFSDISRTPDAPHDRARGRSLST